MPRWSSSSVARPLRKGEFVRIRSAADILATLDATGKRDGLPFMPEMVQYCGRVGRVYRRADKVYLDRSYEVGGMRGAVFLEGLRCDGSAHGNCSMGCLLLWREEWLERIETGGETESPREDPQAAELRARARVETVKEGKFCCQATELARITSRLAWWNPLPYARDFYLREISVRELVGEIALLAYNKLGRLVGFRPYGNLRGRPRPAAPPPLHLQPGEWVEVKSLAEIEETLDASGKNRGMGLIPEMTRYAGRRFRVARRMESVVVEWSGENRVLRDTVALENVFCEGIGFRRCPRSCPHLWREAWLRRVDGPAEKSSDA